MNKEEDTTICLKVNTCAEKIQVSLPVHLQQKRWERLTHAGQLQ